MGEALVLVPSRRAYDHVRITEPRSGCFCTKCRQLRRARDLRAIIAVYEERLATFRRELEEAIR